MKNTTVKTVLLMMVCLVIPQVGWSQIVYSDNKLNINDAKNPYGYSMAINGWSGLYWTPEEQKFFQIDLSGSRARISSHSNLSFYNPQKTILIALRLLGLSHTPGIRKCV